jgi:hypothetical protein
VPAADPEPNGAAGPARAAGDQKACPSALCREGALLLGVMTPSGTLSYIQPPTRVDANFVARAQALGRPESRFRFSSPCVEAGCPQWTGEGCAVVDKVIEEEEPAELESGRLPYCAIRRDCRWFAQRGAAACAVCPRVVADIGGTETYSSTIGSASAQPA